MSWFPDEKELKKIENLAYEGFFSPEELAVALDKTMEDLEAALEQDTEQVIAKAYLKGHQRDKAETQQELRRIIREGDEGRRERLDAIKYVLSTRFAHNETLAVTRMQREIKEKELALHKLKMENEEAERRINRARQNEADRFKRSAFVLSLAQKAQMSEEETRIMAEAAGIGDVV
jgi:hypothetical protein